MNKRILSFIVMLALVITTSNNVFAAPNTLKETQDNKKELQLKIEKLDNEINDVIKKVESNKNDMNRINQDIKKTQDKLKSVEKNVESQEDMFGKRARAMYISGSGSYLEVILGAQDLEDLISRVDMISKVMQFDKNVINKLKIEKENIAKQKERLDAENNKLKDIREKNRITLAKLNKDVAEQKAMLSKVNEKEKELIAMENAKAARSRASSNRSVTLSRGMSKSTSYSRVLSMEATAYSGDGYTASGTKTMRNSSGYSTIAVDPRVIPLGTRVYVEGYGYAVAEDTGGAIKGNIIDIFVNSESEARSWGRRQVNVYIIGD